MSCGFHAIAVDYDGTIAQNDRPNAAALAALAELKRDGMKLILCTGRILDELRDVFPEVDDYFDALVAENGCLVVASRGERRVAAPLPLELADALRERGVPFREGQVLLATDASHADVVLEEIARLGVEAQLVHNKGALMVLPGGVSKGSGLLHALGLLEVSRHCVIGIGDAENDHSLLNACELGVAVAGAVPALRAHADICLDADDENGIAPFLRGPVVRGAERVHARRWQVAIGTESNGAAVSMPGARINLLVAGASCSGKSYFTGVLVERLVGRDYSVCVLDAEGDHGALNRLPGLLTVGGRDPLPSPGQLAGLVRNRFTSLVADLSLLTIEQKRDYARAALRELHVLRATRGFPQWIVIEEADQFVHDGVLPVDTDGTVPFGYCLVTHRPMALPHDVLATIDTVVAFAGAERYAHVPFQFAVEQDGDPPFRLSHGTALMAQRSGAVTFRVAERSIVHVRHQRKYAHAQVPAELRFFFGHGDGDRPAAGNVDEFRAVLQQAPAHVLHAHLTAGDFSRWVRDVLADDEMGGRLRAIERWFHNDPHADVEPARTAIIGAIADRYSLNEA